MKTVAILMSISILVIGSAYAQTQLKGEVTTKTLSEKTRLELGVSPDDFVIAVKQDGSKILYQAQDREIYVTQDGALPEGKSLQYVIQIYGLKESPTCAYYWDNNGNKVWYPKPDCPH